MARRAITKVAILGGGPSGSAAATYLARAGVNVALFTRGKRPPIIVGESLVPAIVPYLRKLGVEKEVATYSQFKGGATFIFSLEDGMSFKFHEVPSAKTTYSYNVPRDRFDDTLLQAAKKAGAHQIEHSVGLESDDGEHLRLDDASLEAARPALGGKPDWIIDATGRTRLIARFLDLPTTVGARKDVALHAHLENVPMEIPGNVHTDRLEHGWSWRIPLRDCVSVGLVIGSEFIRKFGQTAEEQFDAYLQADANTREWSKDAKRITPVMRYTNYQLRTERGFGPNWSLVGDAFGFVDPVFSSGMLIGMQGSEALAAALLNGSDRAMEKYQEYVLRNLTVWQRVADYYYNGRLLTMFRVGEYVRHTRIGRMMDFHFRRHMPRIFTGEGTTKRYSMGLVDFMCRHGLAGNDPAELEIR
ncbi:MAG: NAD(P)/FAD-dependent oxidoreductase [Deltaproteobacteria bacterium]|nr:NAD(P)/FAD-dependent oxidoreductase [Deltaproteobacteria bacterium]MBW2397494.1 NAD(P)/FAD-dependent oxidoreductase [Deltaproteobacteria bacterium]